VSVGNELRQRAAIDVERDHPDSAIGVDRFNAIADRSAADDEDQR
jgi:hypothetical protein